MKVVKIPLLTGKFEEGIQNDTTEKVFFSLFCSINGYWHNISVRLLVLSNSGVSVSSKKEEHFKKITKL